MLDITARGFKLREEIKEKVWHELQRVVKMLPANAEYDVTITFKHDEFKCDITVKHIGKFVRGEAVAKEVLPAVDFAVDDLKRKLRKLKTKLKDRREYSDYNDIVSNYNEDIDVEDETIGLDRTKRIELKVMTDEEAYLQMEMLGHNFFAYKDEDGLVSIVYKRNEKDGSYGKILCE